MLERTLVSGVKRDMLAAAGKRMTAVYTRRAWNGVKGRRRKLRRILCVEGFLRQLHLAFLYGVVVGIEGHSQRITASASLSVICCSREVGRGCVERRDFPADNAAPPSAAKMTA